MKARSGPVVLFLIGFLIGLMTARAADSPATSQAFVNPDDPAVVEVRRLGERTINQVGVALSKETDINRLLEAILLAAKKITNADGGTLYRVMEERTLKFEIMRNDTLNIAMGGTTSAEIPFPSIQLFDVDGKPACDRLRGRSHMRAKPGAAPALALARYG